VSIIEFVQEDWKARARAGLRAESSLPSSRQPTILGPIANPAEIPSEDESTLIQTWGSTVWRKFSCEASPQRQPVAVIVDGTQGPIQEAVIQSALAWFMDVGSAVVIDEERIAGLHPDGLRETGPNGQVWEHARRLAVLLLADAINRRTHVILKGDLFDLTIVQTLLEELTRHGYQVEGIVAQTDAAPRYQETQRLFQVAPQSKLTFLDIDSVNEKPSRDAITPQCPTHQAERTRLERRIVLGTFAAPSMATSVPPAFSSTLVPSQVAGNPEETSPRKLEPVSLSLSPSTVKSSEAADSVSDPNYLRRKALQENIRRRTSHQEYHDLEDA